MWFFHNLHCICTKEFAHTTARILSSSVGHPHSAVYRDTTVARRMGWKRGSAGLERSAPHKPLLPRHPVGTRMSPDANSATSQTYHRAKIVDRPLTRCGIHRSGARRRGRASLAAAPSTCTCDAELISSSRERTSAAFACCGWQRVCSAALVRTAADGSRACT